MFELSTRHHFSAAHFLPRTPPAHKCHNMHGHNFIIVVTVRGEMDPDAGWVLDFYDIKSQVKPLIDILDHSLLNDIEGLTNPTSEMLACWVWDKLKGLPLACVEVKETPSLSVKYFGGIDAS